MCLPFLVYRDRLETDRSICSILSQNHTIVEVGKDLWRLSCSALLLKQGHLDLVAHDHVQSDFEGPQGGILHNFFGQPVPGLSHPHGKQVFHMESPKFQGGPIASSAVTENH